MQPPVALWPSFSGPKSQLDFYVGLCMAMLKHGGDIGVSRTQLMALLPKHVPSLAYYYAQARKDSRTAMKWVGRSDARILWRELGKDPRVAKRGRGVVYFRGPHGRFDPPAALDAYLALEMQKGRCGLDRTSLEGSATSYSVKEGKNVYHFNNFKSMARHMGMNPNDLCAAFLPCLSEKTSALMYLGKMITWKSSVDNHIHSLLSQSRVEILKRSDGSEVVARSCVLGSSGLGRSSIV